MMVIVVEFTVDPKHTAAFIPLIVENARRSVQDETGCRQFDVCRDDTQPNTIFLYELYDDSNAFAAHLAAPHFKAFDAAVAPLVRGKSVKTMQRIEPSAMPSSI